MKTMLFGSRALGNTVLAQGCRSMDGHTRRAAVSLREDLGWPVTFELSFPKAPEA
ncbi:hypothetical protein [Marinobacterium rhizophilum]|uniref:hypothetical protein n=1 Tax=Marinobacterium rhizophilum TaxID=420402 RepID=UPI00037DB48A|nr:hypothetical protein [Marinobacterium rhizophilum]